MREKHPIDERFQRVLLNAEATPPEAVRTALAARMGWTNNAQGGVLWKPLLIVAIGFLGAGTAAWLWSSSERADQVANLPSAKMEASADDTAQPIDPFAAATVEPTTAPSTVQDIDPAKQDVAVEVRGMTDGRHTTDRTTAAQRTGENGAVQGATKASPITKSTRARTSRTSSHHPSDTHRNAVSSLGEPAADHDAEKDDANSAKNDQHISRSQATAEPFAANNTEPAISKGSSGQLGNTGRNDPLPILTSASLASNTSSDLGLNDIQAVRLNNQPILPITSVPVGSPNPGSTQPGYVLPAGVWWIGAYAGMGAVNGQWRGTDVADLQRSERWRSTTQAGIMVGREWRNGWGVSAGLGLARVRSTFEHERLGETESVTEIDTTWAEYTYPGSSFPLYTWSIDSVAATRIGAAQRVDARNLYTAVHVPVNLSWHTTVRRLRIGAFGGLAAWIPTQRKGLSLVRSAQDGFSTTLPLQDAQLDSRFSAQLHGHLGLSLGYSVTEHMCLFFEPNVATPLFSFDGASAPWLTRPVVQIRLQHEFRSKAR